MTSNEQSIRDRSWVSVVEARLKTLRYGVLQIIVHDGRVVQIDTTERTRIDAREQRERPAPRDAQDTPTGAAGGFHQPPAHAGATEPSEFLPRRQERPRT